MAGYVDAFVLVVPKEKVDEYRQMSKDAGVLWMKHGATNYKECMGDDLNPDMDGHQIMTFPQLTNLKPDETVWFSFIEYESKEHRDKVNAKVMADPAMKSEDPDHIEKMPFDMKRMAFGGFSVEVKG